MPFLTFFFGFFSTLFVTYFGQFFGPFLTVFPAVLTCFRRAKPWPRLAYRRAKSSAKKLHSDVHVLAKTCIFY